MKKIILLGGLLILLFFILAPGIAMAWIPGEPIVPQTCGIGKPTFDSHGSCSGVACPCGITDFFILLGNIYGFLVIYIAAPLAFLSLSIGGVFILISAGNPNLAGMGKKMVWAGVIGLVLVFCSWLIINFILEIIGYKNLSGWNSL